MNDKEEKRFEDLWKKLGLHHGYANSNGEKVKALFSELLKERVKFILGNVDDDTREDLENYKFIQDLLNEQ